MRGISGASVLQVGTACRGPCDPGLAVYGVLRRASPEPRSPRGPVRAHQLQQHERSEDGAHEAQVWAQCGDRGASALRGAAGPCAHFRRELGHRGFTRLPEVAPAAVAAPPTVGTGSCAAPPGGPRSSRCSPRDPRRGSREQPGALVPQPRPAAGPAPLTLCSLRAAPACGQMKWRLSTLLTETLRPRSVRWLARTSLDSCAVLSRGRPPAGNLHRCSAPS